MTKPEHYRPFNADHAKAGAPYSCMNGDEATILKWDGRHKNGYRLIGIAGEEDTPHGWRPDGFFGNSGRTDLNLVMLPLGYVEGKPVFWDSEMQHKDGTPVAGHVAAAHSADGFNDYTWPKPAPAYPETKMTHDELGSASGTWFDDTPLRKLANAALRHAIDSGQVVTKAEAERNFQDGQAHEAESRMNRYVCLGIGEVGSISGSEEAIEYVQKHLMEPGKLNALLKKAVHATAKHFGFVLADWKVKEIADKAHEA